MRVLAIGAYERENFGDLLFYVVTKKYINDHADLVVSSIVASDMTETLGVEVQAYSDLLKREKWDAVWVVGGEVGGATVTRALQTVDVDYAEIEKEISPIQGDDLSYIPNLKNYSANSSTPLILNSVGALTNQKVLDLLNCQSKVMTSVRDVESKKYMASKGRDVKLAPDIVHLITDVVEKKHDNENKYFIFQIASSYLSHERAENIKRLAEQLVIVSKKYKWDICLLPAGLASFHDSLSDYQDILKEILLIDPENKARIHQDRNPIAIVEEISGAQLWVGSSLHGRIVSAAYAVPRLSFDKTKLNNYSAYWDESFPYGVKPGDFIPALQESLLVSEKKRISISVDLKELAYENLYELIQYVKSSSLDKKVTIGSRFKRIFKSS